MSIETYFKTGYEYFNKNQIDKLKIESIKTPMEPLA